MNKNYVGLALASLLPACSVAPTTRVHSAASVPRFVDVNPSSFAEGQPRKSLLQGQGGVAYGLGWTDSGNTAGSEIAYLGISLRTDRFAAGWTPYYADAQVSLEGTGMYGSMLWYAVHFGGGSEWRFSYQNTYALANEETQNTGCSGLFGQNCSQTSSARSQVKIEDLGFIFSAERRLGEHDSLVIAPGAYWTNITTGNQLDTNPSGDYVLNTTSWSPALQVGYKSRIGTMTVAVLAGAQWVKTFRPDYAVRQLLPTGDLKLEF